MSHCEYCTNKVICKTPGLGELSEKRLKLKKHNGGSVYNMHFVNFSYRTLMQLQLPLRSNDQYFSHEINP